MISRRSGDLRANPEIASEGLFGTRRRELVDVLLHLQTRHAVARVDHTQFHYAGEIEIIPVDVPYNLAWLSDALNRLNRILRQFAQKLKVMTILPETVEQKEGIFNRHGRGFCPARS